MLKNLLLDKLPPIMESKQDNVSGEFVEELKFADGNSGFKYKDGDVEIFTDDGVIRRYAQTPDKEKYYLSNEEFPDGSWKEYELVGKWVYPVIDSPAKQEKYYEPYRPYEVCLSKEGRADGSLDVYYTSSTEGKKMYEKLSDGTERWYDKTGRKEIENLPDGTKRSFRDNGKVYKEVSNGVFTRYDKSGKIEFQGPAEKQTTINKITGYLKRVNNKLKRRKNDEKTDDNVVKKSAVKLSQHHRDLDR